MPAFRAIRRPAGSSAWRWAVPESTDAVILELGANDALRGLDPARAKANLDKIITTIKAGGAEVLLAGMLAPRNLGRDYVRAFDAIYPDLATKHGLILYPFFLEGVAHGRQAQPRRRPASQRPRRRPRSPSASCRRSSS